MTKKRKRAGIITAKLPIEKFEELAAEVCILHASCKADGYSLSKKSLLGVGRTGIGRRASSTR